MSVGCRLNMLYTWLLRLLLLSAGGAQAMRFVELLQQLQRMQQYESVLLLHDVRSRQLESWQWLTRLWQLPAPVLQLSAASRYSLHASYSSRVLSLVLLPLELQQRNALLQSLLLNLRRLHSAHLLFVLSERAQLQPLMLWCWQQQLPNVLAVLEADFERTSLAYSYTTYPSYRSEQFYIGNETEQLFKPRLLNLQGYRFPVIVSGRAPRLIVYEQSPGRLQYVGVLGHLMQSFEQKYNCVLEQPFPFDPLHMQPTEQLMHAVRNGSVQLSWAANYATTPYSGFSNPYVQLGWCLMLPLPAAVPASQFYLRVFHWHALLLSLLATLLLSMLLTTTLWLHGYAVRPLDFVLHDSCWRGGLAQAFVEVSRAPGLVRSLYVLICTMGMLVTNWYNAHYGAYVTSEPKQPDYTGYDSILQSGLKIVVWQHDYEVLIAGQVKMQKYKDMFQLESSYPRFYELRESLNTRYGYVVPLDKWLIFKEQQQIYNMPLFRYREDLCLEPSMQLTFPLHENSIYRQSLERMLLELAATGLIWHWHRMSYLELLRLGKLRPLDLGGRKQFRAMQVEDLQQIVRLLGCILLLAFLVFAAELLSFHGRRLRAKLWRKYK